MAASDRCLSPGETHTFLTHTIEKKSPFFIPRCMRSFCSTDHNPFFIILTGFKGMWLFLCEFSSSLCIHAALQCCITSMLHDFTLTFCSRLTEVFYWDHSPEKFWKNHPCSPPVIPVPLAPSLPCGTDTCQLCLPCLETSTITNLKCRMRRGGGICFISFIYSINSQTKQSHQAPR